MVESGTHSLVLPRTRASRLSVLIIHFVANLIFVSASGPGRLLAAFRYKVRVLPIRPRAIFRPHWIGRELEPENSVCISGKFQHEESLRSTEVKFDVTSAHAWVLSRVGVPVTWHCVAGRIELRLNVGKIFDGLASGWFHFKLEQRRRAIDVQNMRLTGIPNSETGHRNDAKGETNHYQPGEKPKPSCAAPVKRKKNQACRDDARHESRNRSGKMPGVTIKCRTMKRGCDSCTQSEAEK